MKVIDILYENKYCMIVSPDNMPGVYKLQSKTDKYSDVYYTSLPEALRSIGVIR